MHGSETDIILLMHDLDIIIVNLFDTAQGFSFIQKLTDAHSIEKDNMF